MTSKDFTKWLRNAKDLTMEDILFQLSYVSDMDYFPAQNISHLTAFDRANPEIPMPPPTKINIDTNKVIKTTPNLQNWLGGPSKIERPSTLTKHNII